MPNLISVSSGLRAYHSRATLFEREGISVVPKQDSDSERLASSEVSNRDKKLHWINQVS